MIDKKFICNYKDTMSEWNYEKNINMNPEKVTIGSNKKAWWICKNGHEWEARISSRISGNNCPYCSGKKRLKGFNDIFTIHPAWKEYWDFQINDANNINPYSLGDKSHVKVNWICSQCGKKFVRALSKTKDNILCIECTNKNNGLKHINVIIKNRGSLLDNYSNIAKEWNYEKNGDLKPENVSPNSNKKVWWICPKGHEYQSVISNRTGKNNRNCPYCSNQKILKGYNDLETLYPDLAKEWNYKKNSLKPYEIGAGSGKKYWWICKQGHEYFMSPINRVYGMGCSICSSERKISVPEKTVLYYLKKFLHEEIVSNYRSNTIENKELDIFLPNKNIGIEYDGTFFHKDKKRDFKKDLICEKIGIKVLHIAESKNGNGVKDNYIYYDFTKQANLEWAINNLLNILLKTSKNYDIDIKRDRIEIYNLIDYYEKEQSLLNNYPDLAKEWDYEKNGNLKPDEITIGSNRKIWWVCSRGHKWQTTVHERTIRKHNCPYCTGQKAIIGYNDLITKNPKLAKEWNYKKNGDLNPSTFMIGSNKKVWWICPNGHEYEAVISERNNRGTGCPYCAGQKLLVGFNDLMTKNPKLAKEWNYEKNGNLTPKDFFPNAHKKVWWICPRGHEYEAYILDRNRGTGCTICSGKQIIKGYNDLSTLSPITAKYWNYERNGNLKPESISVKSHKKVWWKCSNCNYEWQLTIASMTKRKCKCLNCKK